MNPREQREFAELEKKKKKKKKGKQEHTCSSLICVNVGFYQDDAVSPLSFDFSIAMRTI